MKNVYLICLLNFIFVHSDAQTVATTPDGRKVILYANGNWRYADRNNPLGSSADFLSSYNDAYKYACDIVYENEFFSNERNRKAALWAREYVSKNVYIPIGSKTLDRWFTDLFDFASNNLFKDIIYTPDQKKASITWVEQTLKDKAYFEDNSLTLIDRHQVAYDVAYNHIYEQEFFDTDRKKKAVQWANEFVRR